MIEKKASVAVPLSLSLELVRESLHKGRRSSSHPLSVPPGLHSAGCTGKEAKRSVLLGQGRQVRHGAESLFRITLSPTSPRFPCFSIRQWCLPKRSSARVRERKAAQCRRKKPALLLPFHWCPLWSLLWSLPWSTTTHCGEIWCLTTQMQSLRCV